jgi:hypothetical protein
MDYAKEYGALHKRSNKIFSGRSITPHAGTIKELVTWAGAKTLLDYGSGKGLQYRIDGIHHKWGGILPTCFDVGVIAFKQKPVGKFNGVICTDVMEHIAEDDVQFVMDEIYDFVDQTRPGFVFFAICCRLAKKSFSNGKNLHLTVRPPDWWADKVRKYRREDLRTTLIFTGS